MPWEIGFSGSWKVQSGRQYGRNTAVAFPGDGTQNDARRGSDRQPRADGVASSTSGSTRAFTFGKFGRLTGMIDMFNADEHAAR